MINIDELKFDEKGLIPAVVTDNENGKVLTLAYMNRESLEISLKKSPWQSGFLWGVMTIRLPVTSQIR